MIVLSGGKLSGVILTVQNPGFPFTETMLSVAGPATTQGSKKPAGTLFTPLGESVG